MNRQTHHAMRIASRSRQKGVGLIEILIAVLILAIGFLAAAKMQVSGMRYSQSAYFDSQAYFMVGDMIARMRANLAGVRTGAYDDLDTAAGLTSTDCTNKMCTPAELANHDLYQWSQYLHGEDDDDSFVALLPSTAIITAAGSITKQASGGFTVSVVWADDFENDSVSRTLSVNLFTEN